MTTFYVYDDEGTLGECDSTKGGHEHENEAAVQVVEELIEWSECDDGETYTHEELEAHVRELENLQNDIRCDVFDLSEKDWYETSLGFTFSTVK